MWTRRARLLLGTAVAALALTLTPSGSAAAMTCSPDFEAVCVVIGTSCRALDTVEAKVLKKDLINCQLG
jgi:hypothetical protein